MKNQKKESLTNQKPFNMISKPLDQRFKGLSPIAVFSFIISLAFCTFIISATIIDRTRVVNMRMEQQIFERAHRISESITRLMYRVSALSAIITQDNTESFYFVAPTLVDNPSIRNVLIAPDGIVTKIFPMAGNENMIGYDLLSDGVGGKEAILARDLGELVLGGPFESVQGWQALVGRLPVFIDTPDEEQKFWGLVSVTLDFPQVLESAELEIFSSFGYVYELWRINPDNNEKQVIASSYGRARSDISYMEKPVNILNAEWFLRISPVRVWYSYPENIALIIAGLCICFIVFFVMQNNFQLKTMQNIFELMAITDPLTGIFNRRHFMEIVRISIEKARRSNENCYFIMFDIDKFKLVNDTYGHQIGDKVLLDVTTRIKADIRPYDLFARYGGEEFIVFTSGVSKTEVIEMTERLRKSLCSRKYEYDNINIEASASFGIAHMPDYNLDKSLKQSDEALYTAKRNGRNCVVYWEKAPVESV
jgi:diguanylate cyclase (GGDEF)-like protein